MLLSNSLILMFLGVSLFEFLPLRFHWISWMCRLMFPYKFGKFCAIISSNILFPSLSSIVYMLVYLMVSHRFWGSIHFSWGFHSSLWIINANLMSECFLKEACICIYIEKYEKESTSCYCQKYLLPRHGMFWVLPRRS